MLSAIPFNTAHRVSNTSPSTIPAFVAMDMKQPNSSEDFHPLWEFKIWVPMKPGLQVFPELAHDVIQQYHPGDPIGIEFYGLASPCSSA